MPLTPFQEQVARLLAANRSPESHLAGGAALHVEPNSKRYSNDLDYFHDSEERVAEAFQTDRAVLEGAGYEVESGKVLPGFVRAVVRKGENATKLEWSHDSAWRFMPPVHDERIGYQLHPVDLAINKLLALAGRDEPRDFLDILYVHETILPLGALCWAAVGKDPGFTPHSLLSLVRRRGKYRPEDFERLHLTEQVDLIHLKAVWHSALDEAEKLIGALPPDEIGCLYYSKTEERFIAPTPESLSQGEVVPHYGRPGGVLPLLEQRLEDNR